MIRIEDLVHLDEQAEFRSDVQLSVYNDPSSNIALLRSYMFGSAARQNDRSATPSKSSVEVLNLLIEAYSHERIDNRLVLIANYGHGKSHLALALANYFGKPADSPELSILYEKLGNALGNGAGVNRYRAFKEGRGRFLVIRLRGDVRRGLREQFVIGLEEALNEHEETRGVSLPFWFDKAVQFLEGLTGAEVEKANAYLEEFRTEVSILLKDVHERSEAAHRSCVALFKHLYHDVTPDFGGDIALKEAMAWTVNSFCGTEKPFGGVMVLFDEFSLYVQSYGDYSAPGELQDLLNGIDDHRGRVAFLAFAQHDPIQVAKDAYRYGQGNTQQESLERELTRLQRKYSLYSVLESVIDSYLLQSEDAWAGFISDKRVQGPLMRASDVTLEAFRKRYESDLNWGVEQVQEILAKGCFPLHPLTTALLCNLQFEKGNAQMGVARTVLGFVRGELELRKSLPAAKDDLDTYINWAMPIGLVEYYGDLLSPTHYQQYKKALQALPEEPIYEQEAVLSALMLQEVAGLTGKGSQQIELLSELSGIDRKKLSSTLKKLSQAKAILYIEYQKQYTFWSLGNDPHKLDEILARYLDHASVDWSLLSKAGNSHLLPIQVKVDWGNALDWQAVAYFLTRGEFTKERLRELAPSFSVQGKKGIVEGERGAVFWLLARNQDDIQWFNVAAGKVIDEAFPEEEPLSVVAVIPERPTPELFAALLRLDALERMTQDERKDIGLELHSSEVGIAKSAITDELVRLKAGKKWERAPRANQLFIVPSAYRSLVRALNACGLDRVLDTCYQLAYQAAPPAFFDHLKLNSTHLKAAVKFLANLLRQNSTIERLSLPQGIHRDLAEMFLREQWAILDTSGQVQKPQNARTRRAWDFLEGRIIAGKETPVREALVPLLNPPFGYDYHTVTLLFCAWFGFNHHDIQLTVDGRRTSAESFDYWLQRDSKDFINRICIINNVGLERRDRAQIDKEANEYLERSSQPLSQEEALQIAEWLIAYGQDSNNNHALHEQAAESGERLMRAHEAAREYDRATEAIEIQIEAGHHDLTGLIGLQNKIGSLPAVDNVRQNGPSAEALHNQWIARVREVVEEHCARLEHITSLTRVELNKEKLGQIKKQLQKAGLRGAMIARVDDALEQIEKKVGELRTYEQEAGERGAIQAMTRDTSLKKLYEFRTQLQGLSELSAATEKLRSKKLAQVEEEIAQLEKLGAEMPEALSRMDSIEKARQWENLYHGSLARFDGVPIYDSLLKAYEEVQSLINFFGEVAKADRPVIQTRERARQIQGELEQLQTQASTHQGKLAAVARAEQAFKQRLREETLRAEQQLFALEERWRDGDASVAMKRELDANQSNLMRPEARKRFDQLRRAVVERIDEDIVTKLEDDFRRITSATQRRECLERLTQVHAELNGRM